MAEFDKFAHRYREILDASVGLSGESSDYFAEAKARYLARLLPDDFDGKVLDYGCGVGLVSMHLATWLPNAELHGFDVSAESIAEVPEPLRKNGRFTSETDALDSDYDAVLIANVLHHIPPSERQARIDELAARLRPSGRLVIVEHNPLNPATRWVVAHCPLDDDAVLLGRRESVRLVERAGLGPARVDYIVFFPRFLSALRDFEPRLRWLPLGAQYAVIGRARAV